MKRGLKRELRDRQRARARGDSPTGAMTRTLTISPSRMADSIGLHGSAGRATETLENTAHHDATALGCPRIPKRAKRTDAMALGTLAYQSMTRKTEGNGAGVPSHTEA